MDYNELQQMTVVKLREEAKKFGDLKDLTGMKKEQLVAALADKHGLEAPAPKPKKAKKAAGKTLGKEDMKSKIAELKALRDAARADKDHKQSSLLRRRVHRLKRRMRKTA